MKKRSGFTLIELLVVVGIIVLLIGILLPVVHRAWRQSQMNTQRLDFQAIASALDKYKETFHAYPSNSGLAGWNGVLPAPQCLSLTVGLIGPGPAITANVNGVIEAGDGLDGFGSRSSCAIVSTYLTSATNAGATSITVQSIGNLSPGTFSTPTIFVGITDAVNGNDDELAVSQIASIGAAWTITFVPGATMQHTHTTAPVAIKTPSGQTIKEFLPADKFKIIWIGGQPQLMDRWGGPIQYFTRFGPNTNRTGTSTSGSSRSKPTLVPTCAAGPLVGDSAPMNALGTYGDHSIYDTRDGTLTAQEALAFQWMLGDDDGDNIIDTAKNETLRYTGEYVLISAGPDTDPASHSPTNPLLPISLFANFNGVPQSQWAQTFKNSGNVYNFDR